MFTVSAQQKVFSSESWGSEREADRFMEWEVSGLRDQKQNLPGSMHF